MSSPTKYAEGEKVLCFHGPLIYEAKCLLISNEEDTKRRFLVHYNGWNKSWDEWVPETRMLKHTEANLKRQNEIKEELKITLAEKKKLLKRRMTQAATLMPPPAPPAKEPDVEKPTPVKKREVEKRKAAEKKPETEAKKEPAKKKETAKKTETEKKSNDAESKDIEHIQALVSNQPKAGPSGTAKKDKGGKAERAAKKEAAKSAGRSTQEESPPKKNDFKINIPKELEAWLVDDCDFITRQRKLPNLPSKPSISDMICNYLAFIKEKKTEAEQDLAALYLNEIRKYFDVTLGSQLLYKFERQLYATILKDYPRVPMSDLYPPLYLLRFFVTMGHTFATIDLDETGTPRALEHINNIIQYMIDHQDTLFSLFKYHFAMPDYYRSLT